MEKRYIVNCRIPGGLVATEVLTLQEALTPRFDWWRSAVDDRAYLLAIANSQAIGYLASILKEQLNIELDEMLIGMNLPTTKGD